MSNEERSAAARYLGARGGRATAAKLTPEQRTENARRAGKARAAQRWGPASVGGMFSAGAQQLEALAEAVGLKGAVVSVKPNVCTAGGFHGPESVSVCMCAHAVVKVEPAPKRSEPKAGTISALVLAYLLRRTLRGKGARTLEDIADGTGLTNAQASNALSSLRSGGHVVSEPKPGSRREKLWRLA